MLVGLPDGNRLTDQCGTSYDFLGDRRQDYRVPFPIKNVYVDFILFVSG